MNLLLRLAEIAVRPASMGIALIAQAYLLQKSADGFLTFNAIYATQNILAHLFYPGIATSAFRAANGFSTIQRRYFYVASAALLALALAVLPFWSTATIAITGAVLTAARLISAQYYLGAARPILSSTLTQILPWSTLILLVMALPDMALIAVLPLLMAVPSSVIALRAILRYDPSQLDNSLRMNWKLGGYDFIQSFKNHGISLLATPFPGAEVAGALFMVKLLSASQNIVAYGGARRVKRFSVALRSHDLGAQNAVLKTAMREGLLIGALLNFGGILLYFQPFGAGVEVLEAIKEYIIWFILLTLLFSPFFLSRIIAVNLLKDGQLFSINVKSIVVLLGVYALGFAFQPPGVTILVSYAAATLYFMAALAYELSQCQKR